MKHFICLTFAFLFLISCASKTDMANKKDIALATLRVGEEFYNSGRYTAALKNILEAYKTLPDDPYLNNSLGLVYLAKQRYGLAENHFKRALDIKPDYINAKNNLGASYLKQKKWDPAIECFEEVVGNLLYAYPEIPLSNLGWVYFQQKMFRKSKMYFEKSLEARPQFLNSVHGLAIIHIETGQYNRAIQFLHHSLEKNPGAAILHSDLAKVYETLKQFEKARRSWATVLKLSPENSPLARKAEKRLFELN